MKSNFKQKRLSFRLEMGRNFSELPFPDSLPLFLLLISPPSESEKGLSAIFKEFTLDISLGKETLDKANQYIYIPDKKILVGPYNDDLGALRIWAVDYDESAFIIKEEFLGIIEPMSERIGKDEFRIVDITGENSKNNILPIRGSNDSEEDDNEPKIFQQRRACLRPGLKSSPLYLHLFLKKLPSTTSVGVLPKLRDNSSEDFYTYSNWQELVSITFSEYYILQENELYSFFSQERKKLREFKESVIYKKSVEANNLKDSLKDSVVLEYIPSWILNVTQKVRFDQAFRYYVLEIKNSKIGPSINDGDRTIY